MLDKYNKMKNTLILILFIFTGIINAQTNPIIGDWLLEKTETEGKEQNINQVVNFDKDGTLYMQDIPFGTWKYKEENQMLFLNMNTIKGDHQIIKNKNNELVIKLNNDITYFVKIDKETIKTVNEKSGLIGVWEMDNKTDINTKIFLTFKTPDNFTLFEKRDGMESTSKGMWIINTKENTLNLIGRIENISGLNILIKVTKEEIIFKNKEKTYQFKKVVQNANKVERLSFLEKNFYEDNGEFKYYDDIQKLPWQDSYQMIAELSKVKQLVYNYSILIESTKSFETKILITNIEANPNEETLKIDNIFHGFDRYNLPEETQLPSEEYTNYSSPLYPLKGDTFRVIGEEKINVPAGSFTCTVVEVLIDTDNLQKVWLINKKPGIIAKIINDKAGGFGYYNTYELKEIK